VKFKATGAYLKMRSFRYQIVATKLFFRLANHVTGSAGVSPACEKNYGGIDSKSIAGETPALPVTAGQPLKLGPVHF
jgi:hypothetical protein